MSDYCSKRLAALSLDEDNKGFVGSIQANSAAYSSPAPPPAPPPTPTLFPDPTLRDAPWSSPLCHYCWKGLAALSLDEGNKGFVGSIQANPAAYSSPAPPPTLFPAPTLRDAPSSSPLSHYCWKGLAALSLDEGNKGFVGSIQAPHPPLLSVYDYDAGGGEGTPPDAIEEEEQGEELKLVPCDLCHEDMWIIEIALKCRHMFHVDCVKPTLDLVNSCPICRYWLQPGDAEYDRRKMVAENKERRRRRRMKKARKEQEKKHFHALETTIRKTEPTGTSKRKNTRFIVMDPPDPPISKRKNTRFIVMDPPDPPISKRKNTRFIVMD